MSCPNCIKGFVVRERDIWGNYYVCVNCAWRRDLGHPLMAQEAAEYERRNYKGQGSSAGSSSYVGNPVGRPRKEYDTNS